MTQSLKDWLQRLETLHPKEVELGLDRCGRVYRRLGSPRPGRLVWTVAGTNGKGSVTAYLAGMIGATGRAVGRYTSPHVNRFNERIVIDGEEASDREIVAALERVERARGNVSLTYFEFTTLAAFSLFAEHDLDAAVLEVGLGGRLDAVNIVNTDCAVITRIGVDHQDFLGHDRAAIALEKGGIMRPGRPLIVGDRDPPASLAEQTMKVGAKPAWIGRDFSMVEQGSAGRYSGPGARDWPVPLPPLRGAHQLDNLATALAALFALLPASGMTPFTLAEGVGRVSLTGRLQPWPGDARLLLDVGHNPLAAEVVSAHLAAQSPDRNACVLGMLADKDVGGVVRQLAPRIQTWYCAGLTGARGQDGDSLARRVSEQLRQAQDHAARAHAFDDVPAALDAALEKQGHDGLILVFGSFQTVAAALDHLDRGQPPDSQCC